MNKIIITLLFTVLIFAVNAQTGLFNITYGDSKDATIENLITEGFQVSSNEDLLLTMTPVDNYLVNNVELRFSPDDASLISWTILYNYQEDEDIETVVLEAIVSWHGEDYVWDDFMEEYNWSLGDDKYVYAAYDYYSDFFYVEYTSESKYDDSDSPDISDDEDWGY